MPQPDTERIRANLTSMQTQGATKEQMSAYLQYEAEKAQYPSFAPRPLELPRKGPLDYIAEEEAARKVPVGKQLLKAAPAIGATALTLGFPQVGIPARIGLAALGGAGGRGLQIADEFLAGEQLPGAEIDTGIPALDIIGAGAAGGLSAGLRGGEEALYEAGGEAAFRVGAKALGPLYRAAGKAYRRAIPPPELEIGAKEAMEVMQGLLPPSKPGIRQAQKGKVGKLFGMSQVDPLLTPGEATTSGLVDFAENMGEYGILGGPLRKVKAARQEMANKALDDFVQGVRRSGLDVDEIGDLVISGLKKDKSIFIGSFKGRYKALDKLSEGVTVDFDPIVEYLGKIQSKTALAPGRGTSLESRRIVNDILKDKNIMAGNTGFMEVDNLRQRLWQDKQQALKQGDDKAAGLAGKLQSMIDTQMDKAGLKLPEVIVPIWRQIRRDYKKGIEPFNATLVKKLMKMDKLVAEDVVKKIFTPNISTRNLINAKKLIGDKRFEEMSGIWLEQTVRKLFKENEGFMSANALATAIKQMDGRNGKNLAVMFDKEKLKTLKGISQYLTLTQQGVGSSTGKLFIQMKQAGQFTLAAGMLTGGAYYDSKVAIGGGIVVIGGPALIARLFSKRATSRLLIYGARLPKGSPQLITLAARLNREIKRMEKEERGKTLKRGNARLPMPTK